MSAFAKIRRTIVAGGLMVAVATGTMVGMVGPALAGVPQNDPVAVSQSDADLAASVQSRLAEDGALLFTNINVTAKGGVVLLLGSVRNDGDRARAIQDARKVPGVAAVKDDLTSFDSNV